LVCCVNILLWVVHMAIVWDFSLRSATNEQDPLYVDYYAYVERSVDGTKTNSHLLYISTEVSYYVIFNVIIDSMGVTETQYYKNGRIILVDGRKPPRLPQKELSFSLSVPPFNDLPPVGAAFHTQSHSIIPPPPTEIAPQPPPPIVIEPPPKVPPEGPPPVKDEPPWAPPDKPPPTFGPPDKPPPPPRLTNDYLTWNAFVAKYGDQIQRWALQVPLDYGDQLPPTVDEKYRQLWARLTGHKADAFIDMGHVIYVAEVKPRLTLACLGQAYFGWQLAVRRYRFDKPVKPACIVSTAPHTLLPIAAQNGITVFVLESITGEPIE
jgi:hypothetical protein